MKRKTPRASPVSVPVSLLAFNPFPFALVADRVLFEREVAREDFSGTLD